MLFIDWGANRQCLGTDRQQVAALATHVVAHCNADGIQAVEHIELCDAQTRDAVDFNNASQRGSIEPSATPWTAGDRTELIAPHTQRLPDLIIELGWKW